ncbi:isoleucine--tRNA ligase [Patescibacteria group bacterium]|nr:isoleucine--tRNA ligase [Patescibacteria group bacterium]
MFKEILSVPDLPKNEDEVIRFWKEIDIVERLKDLRRSSEEKVYYDGPITANNFPHYGHVVQWILKDMVPRYWSMKGYFVSRNMGWDCQGLPVEIEVEKALGFNEKGDVLKYGIAPFNKLCKESVFKYRDAIYEYETRIGRWFDDKDMYYTLDKDFIESIWWAFKELYEKGLIYKGLKVVAYSTRAGCSLSQHEVSAGGYKDMEDPTVVVKFKLLDRDNTYILAWTTTPWTIPGNLMLAIGKKVKYVKVEYENEFYILAATRVEDIFGDKEYKVLKEVKHEDILGTEYSPPYDYFEGKRTEGAFRVIYADHANDEEGTGIVHLAPYGEEDFYVFQELSIKIFDYLDETAHFTNMLPLYKGLFYKDANLRITEDLKKNGVLFSSDTFVHRMPLCWRTNTPLIYKPVESWYVAVTELKERMLEENQKVNWVPDHIKNGISKSWLEGARDWAISRSRFWGTPMPVWVNDKTGEQVVVGSYKELKQKSGIMVNDPHRPHVDEITWKDKENGGVFRRIPDVLDVWFDSGSVPFAKLHYPFENSDIFSKKVPAEYIAESTEQVRWWFYTMHVLGVALFDQIPYKSAVVHGIMLSKDGEKLSKSKKNYPPMDEVLETFGADVLRMFVLTSPIVQGESARFYKEALADTKKEFFLPLWNSLRYFTTYANMHMYEPHSGEPVVYHTLDKWILARLGETINNVDNYMGDLLLMQASRELVPFVQDLSTWYIRRSRDRIKNGDLESLDTLYYVLTQISILMAPMAPFMAESMYKILNMQELFNLESVHLCLYPDKVDLASEQLELLANMKEDRETVTALLSVRSSREIPVRQPLSDVVSVKKVHYPSIVKSEVNVKDLSHVSSLSKYVAGGNYAQDESGQVALNIKITAELKLERGRREMIRKIQDLRKKAGLQVTDEIKVVYEGTNANHSIVKHFGDDIKSEVYAKIIEAGEDFSIEKL